ncbi:MAG: pitrilysin family protein [Candidatus Pacebacteria bacterium]|nr:pitrilysin family protein [Candidatus Paceibacterota bacterium]
MKLAFDPYQFNTKLSNGVQVHWKNVPWANGFVYVNIIMSVGAMHDPIGKQGLAHFIEHMPFNGCTGHSSFEKIEKVDHEIFRNTLNACTDFEKTIYSGKLTVDKLPLAMEFMRNFIFFPSIDPTEVERERKVIIQEIWRKYINVKREDFEKRTQKMLYGTHPFGKMDRAFGWHDSVTKINHDDLLLFHRSNYLSENMRVVIVGDISAAKLKSVDVLTGSIPTKQSLIKPAPKIGEWINPRKAPYTISAGKYFGLKGASIQKSAEVTFHRISPIQPNNELPYIAREMLRQILFEEIRGKLGATYTPKVSGNRFIDHSSSRISLLVDPDAVTAVKQIIEKTVTQIGEKDRRQEKRFNEAKTVCLEDKITADRSVESIADAATREVSVTSEIISVAEDYALAKQITYSDVARFFSEELTYEKLFCITIAP